MSEDVDNDNNQQKNASVSSSLEERFRQLAQLFDTNNYYCPSTIDDDGEKSSLQQQNFNYEFFLDLLIAVYTDLQRNVKGTRTATEKNSSGIKFCQMVKPLVERIRYLQLKSDDFDQLKIIGKGAFGQVSLVKCKHAGEFYAMKVLNKLEMTKRAEKACFKEEREILLNGSKEWFTRLHYAFQDTENLYLIMDYYIGGDFLTLLSKYEDTLPEDMCRFYSVQMIMAISALHKLGYIHRDIKPHNILIDSAGHIRLADFGSCIRATSVRYDPSAPIGTPDYVSPEILQVMEGKNQNDCPYSFETDWWSLGILMFESFYGETPFYAESLVETYFKIMNHKIHFMFPGNAKVSDEAKDLISNLVTDRESRYKTLDQFQSHPWFTGIDWSTIRYQTPPYQPHFSGPEDTSNFDISDTKPNGQTALMSNSKDIYVELSFVGFTSTLPKDIMKQTKIDDDEERKNEMKKDLETKNLSSNETTSMALPDEQQQTDSLDQIMVLESRLKSAQKEWSEMSALLAEMKKEKNGLSNKLRMKEEELDEHIDKNSQLRQQLRNHEKMKRQHLEDISQLEASVEEQRILRKQDVATLNEYREKIDALEKKLHQHETETFQSYTSEKQNFVKKITELEQQTIRLEEENINSQSENNELKKFIKELNGDIQELEGKNIKMEKELKGLLELISSECQFYDSIDKMINMIDFNFKKYKFLNEKNSMLGRSTSHGLDQSTTGSRTMMMMMNQQGNITSGNNTTSWRERRSAKVDKQELLTLQLELRKEIADKQKTKSEFIKLQQDFDNVILQWTEAKDEINRLKREISSIHQERGAKPLLSVSTRSSEDRMSDLLAMATVPPPPRPPDRTNVLLDEEFGTDSKTSSSQRKAQTLLSLDSNDNNYDNQNKFGHSFIIRTFLTPIKCYICTSLMIGLVRQGYVCEGCGYACHVGCVELGSSCPFDETKQRPVGIDPQRGIGTAYEGFVKIPKPRGGVRKGWIRMFVVVCDFKLFLFDINTSSSSNLVASMSYGVGAGGSGAGGSGGSGNDSNHGSLINTPSISASTIIDMRDEHFNVSDVNESDVIHASPKDVPCIFRITASMIGDNNEGLQKFTQLMLVDKECEKHKWIDALTELHRIVRRNRTPQRHLLRCYHLLNTFQINTLRHNIYCCEMIDDTRLLIGCEDCLICCDLESHSYHRLNQSKKFYQITYVPSEQLVVALCGKQRQIRLIPIRALDNEGFDWIKIPETKNASLFTVAYDGSVAYICVAIRKTLNIFEITHNKTRYALHHEIQMPVQIQTLNTCKRSLVAVGTSSNFVVYNVNRYEQPLYLVNQDSPDLIYLIQNSIDPFLCHPVGDHEWLLVFAHYGVYVDDHGKRTRCLELQYPSQPQYASILRSDILDKSYLLMFSQTHIDVFDIDEIRWIQTINIKATKPLQNYAENTLFCITNALDLPNLIQIVVKDSKTIRVSDNNIKPFTLVNLSQKAQNQQQDLKKNMKFQISAPTDFSYIAHLGPGAGPFSAQLIDLSKDKKLDPFHHSSSKESSLSKSHSSLQYK